MKRNSTKRSPSEADRQQLLREIKKRAKAARAEKLYGVRLENAMACGRALCQLREVLGHGSWGSFVEDRCGMSRMTANRYMRLASRTKKLDPNMSIREAYIAAGVITPR
jgi:hypothetical protein